MRNSRYAFLGAMRAVAQSISYEVYMRTCLFGVLLLVGRYDLKVIQINHYLSVCVGWVSLCLWLISVLAETNRAPFDFVEGESELVAGYITEVGGVGFALLALGEYRNIMFMATLTSILFLSPLLGSGPFGVLFFSF